MTNTATTYTTNTIFHEHTIFTTVTKDPDTVHAWITETKIVNHQNPHRRLLIVGLDTKWRPSYQDEVLDPVAVLQLCIGNRCLVFQIIHAKCVPLSLIVFLNNPSYIFTGVGVDKHVERLWEYGLVRRSFDVVDIQQLAVRKHGWNIDKLSLDVLARDVIGRERKKPVKCASIGAFVAFDSDHRVLLNVLARDLKGRAWEKPVNERIDKWDNQYLSTKQVTCVSIDAFLSFELGRVLLDQ